MITISEKFTHLHVHTCYSLLDGISTIEELVNKVKQNNQTAFAITEHGNVFSSIKAYKLAKENNLKYIYGMEFYITDDRFEKNPKNRYSHLTVLAKDEVGRKNLNMLSTLSYVDGFYYKPRIDHSILEKYKDGLIVLSSCLAGEISKAIVKEDKICLTSESIKRAKTIATNYKNMFKDDYYIEVQAHSDPLQQSVNKMLVSIAKELDIQYVATADSHYTNNEDMDLHGMFVKISQDRNVNETYTDCYLQTESEVRQRLQSLSKHEIETAILNTSIIADKCNVELPLSAPMIPHVKVPDGYDSELHYLKQLCNKGWKNKQIHKKHNTQEYKDRLIYEINAIQKMGFEGYFLLVESYANSVERRGIARGSGGGSLVAYLVNIVDIDPVEYGLYFERFIDIGALELLEKGIITKKELKIPDFDLDFGKKDREKVLQFIGEKYGKERFVSLGQFSVIWDKTAIKDFGKVLGIPFDETNKITKLMEDDDIDDAIESGKIKQYVEKYPQLFEYAKKIAGLPKSFGIHPCFTKGHMITTIDGHKPIEDIVVGDKVLTHNNRFKNVDKVITHMSNDICTLSVAGSRPLHVTSNHPMYARQRLDNKRRIYGNPTWINVEDLKPKDVIGIAINNESDIPTNEYNLPYESNDFWWLVGRYIGDGWTTYVKKTNTCRTIICANKNGERSEIEKVAKKLFNCHVMKDKTTDKITTNNRDLFNYLNTFGKYAHGKHLTKDVLNLPIDLLKSFLDGYFSADGYMREKYNEISCKTVSKKLAYDLRECIYKVYNRTVSIGVIPAKTDVIEGRTVNAKEKYALSFRVGVRSRDRAFYEDGYLWTPVYSVEQNIGLNETVYNFSVSDDNSYTVNNLIAHNCGRTILLDNSENYTAIAINNGVAVLQGDMHDADDLGIVKIDTLGLRTLDVIFDTLELIGKDYDYIAPRNLSFDDKEVMDMFSKGHTVGVFQFESQGMQTTLKKMQPKHLNDLGVANALFRPGSIKFIDNYINRKNGTEEVTYTHPDLESILKTTYGIIVYQESLIEIGRLAGMKNPDLLRKATGKKNPKLLEQTKPELVSGLTSRGWSEAQIEELWESMLMFARYSFNKSHAFAYAMTAYITGVLKTYHPKEFICSLLNSYIGDNVVDKYKKIQNIYDECKNIGVNIRLPYRNEITEKCYIKDDTVIFGGCLIKYLNKHSCDDLRNLSNSDTQWSNDFVLLCKDIIENTSIDTRSMEIFIQLGLFEDFGRKEVLLNVYSVMVDKKKPDFEKYPQFEPKIIIETSVKKKTGEVVEMKKIIKKLLKYSSALKDNTKEQRLINLYEYFDAVIQDPPEKICIYDQIEFEKDVLGFANSINIKAPSNIGIVVDINKKYTPRITLLQICTGIEFTFKISKKKFWINDQDLLRVGDVIQVIEKKEKDSWKNEDGKWIKNESKQDVFIEKVKILQRGK